MKRLGWHDVFVPISDGFARMSGKQARHLGRIYLGQVWEDAPDLARQCPAYLHETAGAVAELVVSDQAVQSAQATEEKLAALEEKILRAIASLLDSHARFLCEQSFYQLRADGYVHVTQ